MSIVQPTLNEVFSIRVYKNLTSNPLLSWANTYEVRLLADSGTNALADAVDRISQFERYLYVPETLVNYAVVSTFVPDSQPYDGDEFLRIPILQTGLRPAVGDDIAPLQICARVNFTPFTGRTGFRLYRGSLRETDIKAPSGNPQFNSISDYNGLISTAITNSGLDSLVVPSATTAVQLVLASQRSIRPVGAIGAAGVTVKKLNNRYYDRGA